MESWETREGWETIKKNLGEFTHCDSVICFSTDRDRNVGREKERERERLALTICQQRPTGLGEIDVCQVWPFTSAKPDP